MKNMIDLTEEVPNDILQFMDLEAPVKNAKKTNDRRKSRLIKDVADLELRLADIE